MDSLRILSRRCENRSDGTALDSVIHRARLDHNVGRGWILVRSVKAFDQDAIMVL